MSKHQQFLILIKSPSDKASARLKSAMKSAKMGKASVFAFDDSTACNIPDEIQRVRPLAVIALGSDASGLVYPKFKYLATVRGKLFDYALPDGSLVKLLMTYSPQFLVSSAVNEEKYGDTFLQDLGYAVKFAKGELVDIRRKELRFAKTFKDFEGYYNERLAGCSLPAYDIETNAQDPRSDSFRIVGYSLAPDSGSGIYVIRESLEYRMPEADWDRCVELTKTFISSRPVLVHNIAYERPATLNEWGVLINDFEDSLIKSRLLLGGRTGAGLKEQCARNLGYPDWDTDLHAYLGALRDMVNAVWDTPSGKRREEYDDLNFYGFRFLSDRLNDAVSAYEAWCLKYKDIPQGDIPADDMLYPKGNPLDARLLSLRDAMNTIAEVIEGYYEDGSGILELVGKEALRLADIRHEGMISFGSVPLNIITRYGALDSVGTQDLNTFLSGRMDKESTKEVDLWNGYRIMKAHFLVGTDMEMNGLYWNDAVASGLKDWLSGKAYDAMVSMLRSGFLDDEIFANSQDCLLDYVRENEMGLVAEKLGDFDIQTSGIKLTATGERITWKKLLCSMGDDFIQSHKPQIVDYVKSRLDDRSLFPDYASFKKLFNPTSNLITGTLRNIFMNEKNRQDMCLANTLNLLISEINGGLDVNSVPNPDRVVYAIYMNMVKWNSKVASGEAEGEAVPKRVIFRKMAGIINEHCPRTEGLRKTIETGAQYSLKDASEGTIVSLYENMTVMGYDIEDETTWSPEFRFLLDFRTFKKCVKLISSYIDGDKVGRGSVWVVDKKDLDGTHRLPVRKRAYFSGVPKSDDEEYLMQGAWGICTANTLRWRCLAGGTRIPLADGTCPKISDLEGRKNFLLYSVDGNGDIVVGTAVACRKTGENEECAEVWLDNGQKIVCTPDHRLMLADGRYKRVDNIRMGDKLKSFCASADGFPRVSENENIHSVTNIVFSNMLWEVFDIEVAEYHNFAIGQGVFVHNSGIHTLPAGPMVKGIYTSRYRGGVIAAPDYCLAGDTSVLLADGTERTLEELEGQDEFFVYSFDEQTGRIVLGRGHDCRAVRLANHTLRIAFDDGSCIECSDDHTFMKLASRSFVKAGSLCIGDTIQTLQWDRKEGLPEKTSVTDCKTAQGEFKRRDHSVFEIGLLSMLRIHSAEDISIRFGSFHSYDNELRRILGVSRLPKGMGFRSLGNINNSLEDFLAEITDNPITVHNLKEIKEIKARIPRNGITGAELFEAMRAEGLPLEDFDNSRLALIKRGIIPANCNVTSEYVNKVFGDIATFYQWHTFYRDSYATGFGNAHSLPDEFSLEPGRNIPLLSSDLDGEVSQQEVYDSFACHSRMAYRVYVNDSDYIELAPGQRVLTASGLYKYPYELGGYTLLTHYAKWNGQSLRVAEYDDTLSVIAIRVEQVFYKERQGFYQYSVDSAHNYLVPVSEDNAGNIAGLVLHNDSKHRYITGIERIEYSEPKALYCFTVDYYHNFFAGNGVLTHQSQQEVRTVAGLAGCDNLLEAYRNGEDVHMRTAMSVFHKPKEEITKNERRFCKMATFAILYGASAKGLSDLASTTVEDAQNMMDGFYRTYPELKTWMDARHQEVMKTGRVSCPKIGYFLDIDVNGKGGVEEAFRQAGNAPVQGQASMIAGYVLSRINDYFLERGMRTKPISFIHDSLEFDIPPDEIFEACRQIIKMMNGIPSEEFGVPSKADLTLGMSMGDENEVVRLEEYEDGTGGEITLRGYKNDLDALLESWKGVYASVEAEDDEGSIEEIYVPRKEMFMPKLTISKYSGTKRIMITRTFKIKR